MLAIRNIEINSSKFFFTMNKNAQKHTLIFACFSTAYFQLPFLDLYTTNESITVCLDMSIHSYLMLCLMKAEQVRSLLNFSKILQAKYTMMYVLFIPLNNLKIIQKKGLFLTTTMTVFIFYSFNNFIHPMKIQCNIVKIADYFLCIFFKYAPMITTVNQNKYNLQHSLLYMHPDKLTLLPVSKTHLSSQKKG